MRVSRSSSSEGFALVGIIAIVVVLGAIIGAGYLVMSRNKDEGSTKLSTQEQKLVEEECSKEIDDKDFCKFATNWSFGTEYKMTLTTTGGSDSGTFVTEADGDDTSTIITSSGGEESRFIYLNGSSYVYDSETSVWVKYPASTENTESIADDFSDDFDFDNTDLPEAEQVKYESLGKEPCGNQTCFKYQIKDPATPSIEQFIWFDDDEYKMRRFTTSENETTTDAKIEYVNVTINEPSPVQDYSQPEGVPTEAELQELMDSIQQQQ